jgi:hypothetical protein
MPSLSDNPFAPLKEALQTVTGRMILIMLAIIGGTLLGLCTAVGRLNGALESLPHLPAYAFSFFFSFTGLAILPLLIAYAILSIRQEWPLWLSLICTLLMWWGVHKEVRWQMFDSPKAQLYRELNGKLQESLRQQSAPQ